MKRITPLFLCATVLLSSVLVVDQAEAKRRGRAKKDLVVRGTISALSSGAVVVDGQTIVLKTSTKYEDFSGNRVSLAAFVIGDCVKVKLARAQIAATAREMELEDSCPASVDDSATPTAAPTVVATRTSVPAGTVSPSPTVAASPSPESTSTPDASPSPDGTSTPGGSPSHSATPVGTVTPGSTPTCKATPHFEDDDSIDDDRDDDRSGKHRRRGRGRGRNHTEDRRSHVEDNHSHLEDNHRRR